MSKVTTHSGYIEMPPLTATPPATAGGVVFISGTGLKISRDGATWADVAADPVDLKSGTGPVKIETPTGFIVRVETITAASGGVALTSYGVVSITVKNPSANTAMYIGSPDNRPYSGYGFELGAGEAISADLDTPSKIYIVATTSGQQVAWFAVTR